MRKLFQSMYDAAAGAKLPDDHHDGVNLLDAFEGKPAQRTKPPFWKPGAAKSTVTPELPFPGCNPR